MVNRSVDVGVVGAGFAGLYTLHAMRGLGLTAHAIEAAEGVGGTWWWNRYPGARCDVPSLEYSFGFDAELQDEWEWTERYPTQPEILRYIDHVADRFDLRRSITFNTRVQSAAFDDGDERWHLNTDTGETLDARFLVMATGCLSAANIPNIEGRDDFAGRTFHTGHWPHEGVDFTGRRVAVVGTGSSGVQSIPMIAHDATSVTVFQRTPAYAVPAHNRPLLAEELAAVEHDYAGWRDVARMSTSGFGGHLRRDPLAAQDVDDAARKAIFQRRWDEGGLMFLSSFTDLMVDPASNDTAASFVRSKIAEAVDDPEVAAMLSPSTIIGCKRMCVDSGYYETFNRENVKLVDVGNTPIDRITVSGLSVDGREYVVDDIVFATGFDAMTGALDRIDIRGSEGIALRDVWAEGPKTYLGIMTAGFPNLFTITGPGSPSVLTNMIVSIEQHVEFVRDLIGVMTESGQTRVEPSARAQKLWVRYVNSVAGATLFSGCSSWYLGANVPGKPRVFMPLPGLPEYVEKCEGIVAGDYEGFVRSP